jgi:hypothetical protein
LQEQLRKRKDEEERQKYLNRSLRGSRKLQALESHATSLAGQENLAYAQDELTGGASPKPADLEEPPRPLSEFFSFRPLARPTSTRESTSSERSALEILTFTNKRLATISCVSNAEKLQLSGRISM